MFGVQHPQYHSIQPGSNTLYFYLSLPRYTKYYESTNIRANGTGYKVISAVVAADLRHTQYFYYYPG